MVLPIIVGLGVTVVALVTRSGLRAWSVYRSLAPITIARMNKIKLTTPKTSAFDRLFISSKLNSSLKQQLDQYYGGFYHKMTEAEALLVLGISPQEINELDSRLLKQKHRQSMIRNHPDRGGSPYVATKINEARDILENSVMLRKR